MWLDDLRRDVYYAIRTFVRTPAFSIVAILTIAIGIGANTAIFSVVRAVILQPLPYVHADRLVVPYENIPAAEMPNHRARRQGGMVLGEVSELRHRATTLSNVAVVALSLVTGIGPGDAGLISGAILSSGTLAMLGVPPQLGRWFTAEEEQRSSHVVIVSDTVWRKYFAADKAILHRTITFSGNSSFVGDVVLGTAYEIVGVMPRGFHYPSDSTQFWLPAGSPEAAASMRMRGTTVARLRDGVSPEAAAAEIATIVSEYRGRTASHAPFAPRRFELVRLQDEIDASLKQALLVLMAAVGFVLLIASANVANLLLARAVSREREIAVRVSLGAGRGRLIRQLLTESVLLALAGGVVGTALAFGGVELFHRLATNLARFDLGSGTTVVPRLEVIEINRLVFVFALATSVGGGILFGLAPAVRATRQLQTARSFSGLHGALVVAEIALAVPLLVGGALLVRTFINLVNVDPGYDVTHALTFQVGVSGDKYPPARLKIFADHLVDRLRAMPEVTAVGYGRQLPMVQLQDTHSFRTKPDPPPPGPAPDGADGRYVAAGYLPAIGARLVAGHWPNRAREVAINRTLARREFGATNAVGATVYIGRSTTPLEVAAVIDDERLFGLEREPPPQFFADLSLWDGPPYTLLPIGPYFAIRTRASPQAVLGDVASVVRQLDATAPLFNVATLEQIVSNSVTLPRMYAVLLGMFSTLALGLAAVGLYGLMAYAIVRRTREIGIRIALGAQRASVLALILRRALTLTAVGLAIGLAAAAATTRYLQSLLFGLTATDWSTFVAATVMFTVVAAVASYLPARRALRIDPSVALRAE